MPDAITKTWTVMDPEGHDISFVGPVAMTDEQVIQRAKQEYAFKSGQIPDTQLKGIGASIADQSDKIGMVTGLAGAAFGQPEISALAPWVGRGAKAVGQYISGRKVETPDPQELGLLTAESALAYTPALAEKFAASTVAHPSSITGNYIKGVAGGGVPAWMVRTAGEAAHGLAANPAFRAGTFAAPDMVRQLLMEKLRAQYGGGQP